MARSKRKSKKDGGTKAVDDDESTRHVPDPNSEDFVHGEIDQFHADQNKILLDHGASFADHGPSSEEEEILGVGSDGSDGDEEIAEYERQLHRFRSQGFKDDHASDVEDDKDKDDLDEKAWGKSASDFYGTDIHDDNLGYLSGSDGEVDAVLEEKEALAIQRRLTAQLDQQDLALDLFQPVKKSSAPIDAEKIKKDLTQLSRKEKLKLLKKESPELLGIMDEFKAKLTELRDRLLPVHTAITEGKLPPSKGADYVKTKVTLYLNYCVNLSHYLTLKARHTSVADHPVVSRIMQYRNLLTQLEAVEESYRGELDYILRQLSAGEEIALQRESEQTRPKLRRSRSAALQQPPQPRKRKLTELVSDMSSSEDEAEVKVEVKLDKGGRTWGRKKTATDKLYETRDEQKALEYYAMLKAGRQPSEIAAITNHREEPEEEVEEEVSGEEEGEEEDERRGINYKIAKNKGLTPKRKKENRNPRVKNRLKYQKAKKRRKGQVREVRKELKPYGGELSGIRAGVKKSVKFKA